MGVDVGKRVMQNVKPFDMKRLSILHNTFMFVLSLYMVIETMSQVGPSAPCSAHFVKSMFLWC